MELDRHSKKYVCSIKEIIEEKKRGNCNLLKVRQKFSIKHFTSRSPGSSSSCIFPHEENGYLKITEISV